MGKKVVVAIGGNSLITDPQHQTVEDQYLAAAETDHHIAGLVADGWDVVITHGNGPQIGFILRRSDLASHELHEVPLDVCGADTQGAIGYMFQRALRNEFRRRQMARRAISTRFGCRTSWVIPRTRASAPTTRACDSRSSR